MENPDNENEIIITEETELDEETKRILAKIPKYQLKKLVQPYKPQLSEKQKERNDKLVALNKVKWDKLREERLKFEEQQLRVLSNKVQLKPKQKYIKKPVVYVSEEEDDEQDIEEYQQYMKWKNNKSKVKPIKEKQKQVSDDEDDGYIQKTRPKIEKATEILNTVNKLDNALKTLNIGNPYFEAMNRKR